MKTARKPPPRPRGGLPLVLDQSLLREASLRSTGANVHAVRGVSGLYVMAQRDAMRGEFETAERRLRQFVATGCLQPA